MSLKPSSTVYRSLSWLYLCFLSPAYCFLISSDVASKSLFSLEAVYSLSWFLYIPQMNEIILICLFNATHLFFFLFCAFLFYSLNQSALLPSLLFIFPFLSPALPFSSPFLCLPLPSFFLPPIVLLFFSSSLLPSVNFPSTTKSTQLYYKLTL